MEKHVLITGTTKGLGRHLAASFAARGWRVTGLGRRLPADASTPAGVRYLRCDLAKHDEVENVADRVGETLDLVINNAAIYAPPADERSDSDYLARMMQVNAIAPFVLTRSLLRLRADDRRPCSVVMLNSSAAYHTDVSIGAYSASKAALLAFARALADEYRGRNVSVATLVLGPLANDEKRVRLQKLAAQKGLDERQITSLFLRKWDPNLVIDELIDFDKVLAGILFLESLGSIGNGMICRLDGAASGILY